ncbi:MAG TPA: FecR family protein [Pedobacter sp.]
MAAVLFVMNAEELQQIITILNKITSGTVTPAEQSFFDYWLQNVSAAEYRQLLDVYEEETNASPVIGSADPVLLHKIQQRLTKHGNSVKIVPLKKYLRFSLVAASLLILISTGYFILSQKPAQQLTAVQKNDVGPGGNKAILTLANGTKIVLNSASSGRIAQQGHIDVNKIHDGVLVYDASKQADKTDTTDMRLAKNTITTPKGGQYQVVLPDGSKVWLNSVSSLTFPTSFTGKERNVKLTGEAYFEVAKNKEKPFIVDASSTQVKVLGTHFNIMAYQDESSVNATLLEGSVKVIHGIESKIIVPGQMARITDNIQISAVNINHVVAWKNGKFAFSGEKLESIMRKISRWYNVDIIYNGAITRQTFIGSVSKYRNVSEVLKVLELTDLVHFKVEGRRITVMP